jgi:uncharacterized protein
MERRQFLSEVAAAGGLSSLLQSSLPGAEQSEQDLSTPASALPRISTAGELRGDMLYRNLGQTGVSVSAIGMGGSHIAKPALQENESIRLIQAAIDRGITFMDNAWDYNQGESEMRMGKALSQGGYRQRVFLMTKLDGRTKEAAARQIESSLSRLRTDHIDLIQHHEVVRFEDPDRIFGEGGAMEACVEAKQAGAKLNFSKGDPACHKANTFEAQATKSSGSTNTSRTRLNGQAATESEPKRWRQEPS